MQEVIADMLLLESAWEDAYRIACEEHNRHKGGLTAEVARKYAAKSWIYRVTEGNQYCGKVREMAMELQELYGVTELEAMKGHYYGWDTMDFNDNVRKDFNYG